jgi:RHS repeat-associated protein
VTDWIYDNAGHLLNDGATTRTYDALNRVLTSDMANYGYIGDGTLVRPTLGGTTTSYVQALATPFGFARELQQSGDLYLRARWYTPSSGQFVSKDPFAGMAEMPYSLNPYQYAYSNPVLLTDATGERPGVPINARDVTLWLYLEMRQNVDDARLQQIRNYNSEGNELTKRAIIHPFKKCLEAILASAYSSSIALQNIQNIEEETKLQLIAASTAYASGGLGFYGLVADQKPWDFKHSILRLLGSGVTLCGNQGCKNDVEYSVPGNIHFGFVAGEAGYSGGISLLGAGVAEASDPAHDPEKAAAKNVAYTGPYDPSGKFDVRINSDGFGIKFYNIGDDPKDAAAVRFGLDLHRKYGRSLTFATFSQELSSVLPSLASAAPFPQPVLSTITKDWPYNVGYFAP